MNNNPELIVMLTYNDCTVENAYEIFEQCKNSKAKLFGITKDGRYEVIKFEDETGKEKEQTLYLSGFTAYTNFTFMY